MLWPDEQVERMRSHDEYWQLSGRTGTGLGLSDSSSGRLLGQNKGNPRILLRIWGILALKIGGGGWI
jgi:hypothetical protein